MTSTRDQVRAARMLLHLQQDELARISEVGIATLKRFETGSAIRPQQEKALLEALRGAGAILFDGTGPIPDPIGAGVALFPSDELPEATRTRIAAAQEREAVRLKADKLRRDAYRDEPRKDRRRGRPGKIKDAPATVVGGTAAAGPDAVSGGDREVVGDDGGEGT